MALWSLVEASLFAGAVYGIQTRASIVWKLGWGALGLSFLTFTVQALSFSLKLPPPERWIASAAILVVGAAVATYWGLWWKRQKSYFSSVRPQDSKSKP